MAQLIEMRKRIAAIETTKKITHAMRLIAMSTHSRLKGNEEPLKQYKNSINALCIKLQTHVPEWHNPVLNPETAHNPLIVLIGSTKGLCGSFNAALFHFYESELKKHGPRFSIIAAGKKAVDYAQNNSHAGRLIASYKELNSQTMLTIAHEITNHILQASPHYSSVVIYSNMGKTFFLQRPTATTLIPFAQQTGNIDKYAEDYFWEQNPLEILDLLIKQSISAHIQYLLFVSLLAEHAARFLSMDGSTRNAQNLLEITKLNYNKLRQAKITKEIAELIGSF